MSGDGWTRCSRGHRHWGRHGAAGPLHLGGGTHVLQQRHVLCLPGDERVQVEQLLAIADTVAALPATAVEREAKAAVLHPGSVEAFRLNIEAAVFREVVQQVHAALLDVIAGQGE